jgi:hypothetical protein
VWHSSGRVVSCAFLEVVAVVAVGEAVYLLRASQLCVALCWSLLHNLLVGSSSSRPFHAVLVFV